MTLLHSKVIKRKRILQLKMNLIHRQNRKRFSLRVLLKQNLKVKRMSYLQNLMRIRIKKKKQPIRTMRKKERMVKKMRVEMKSFDIIIINIDNIIYKNKYVLKLIISHSPPE